MKKSWQVCSFLVTSVVTFLRFEGSFPTGGYHAANQPTTCSSECFSAAGPRRTQTHRGVAVLILGILGIALCLICGIIAWVMGKNDLKEMDAGVMDPAGRGMTKAGKICGMIGVILQCVALVFQILAIIIMAVVRAAA